MASTPGIARTLPGGTLLKNRLLGEVLFLRAFYYFDLVNHFGDDPEIRWVAFDAAAPGADENCFLSWNGERELYEERSVVDGVEHEEGEVCRELTFPPNGEGLDQYPWRVDEDGLLIIDLRPDDAVSVNGTAGGG